MRAAAAVTLLLALVVVVVGAYVRLSDAGLGCPDWPLCYGRPLPVGIADADALAKAWKEMGHRYLAGTLGLLILLMTLLAWKRRRMHWLATAVLAAVAFQATLGAWTVTLLLKPAIVTAHLLGGMAIVGMLTWLALEAFAIQAPPQGARLRLPATIGLAVLSVQIALGGWVSSNYAALACPDVPLCRGAVIPPMDLANAFHVLRELGQTAEGELLSLEALTAIHWGHRAFALAVVAVFAWVVTRTFRASRAVAVLIGGLLVVQFSLGVANVLISRPLVLAAAHNGGAALLVIALVVLNFFAFRGPDSPK